MMQATIERASGLGSNARPIIVTNADHADAISRDLVGTSYEDALIILEPVGRNTAPAVAVAAHEALTTGDPLMLVLPADHSIADKGAFRQAITYATEAAAEGYLVTFGITPSRPETGYGYIKVGSDITKTVRHVSEFREKPDFETAGKYIDSGDYLWNSGMFLMRASIFLHELEIHAPDIATASAAAYTGATLERNRLTLDSTAFTACRAESIDYAVMEPTSMAAVVPTDPGWNDVGTWASLWDIAVKDTDGNVLIGDVISDHTTNSYIRSDHRLVATLGLDEVIVVDTPDAVLIANINSVQDVKIIVDSLRKQHRSEAERPTSTRHSWGRLDILASGENHRVARLLLDPGALTSPLEGRQGVVHWHVVAGTARITTGEPSRLVSPGESVYIGPGEPHQLENTGSETLEVIEVRTGRANE